MKAKTDHDLMTQSFQEVYNELEKQLFRGVEDESIRQLNPKNTAQVIISLMVGVNRTKVLTPYAYDNLYKEAIEFVSRSISRCKT